MSNKLFQSLIYQMKEELDCTVGVIDDKGVIIACSQLTRIGETDRSVFETASYSASAVVHNGCTYKPFGTHGKAEYVVFVEGTGDDAKHIAGLLSVSLTSVKALYDEKYDKANFIKNIILDNILPSDIYLKAKELHLDSEVNRVVYLIRFHNHSNDAVPFEIIQNMFPDKSRDYVISVGENDIVLVKELKTAQDSKSIEANAKSIVDTVSSEFYLKVTVGIGSVVSSIKELAHSFKDAQVALLEGLEHLQASFLVLRGEALHVMADVMRPFALSGKVLAGKQNYRAVGVFLSAPGAVEQLLEQFLILDHQ